MSALGDALLRMGLLAAVAAVVVVLVVMRERRRRPDDTPPDPAPGAVSDGADAEPEEMTLGDRRNRHLRDEYLATGRESRADWAECPCCGCPTYDAELDFPSCEVCGWDGDADVIDAGRHNFAAYGSVYSPDEAAALGRPLPSEEELRIIRDIASRCAATVPDQPPPAEFWTDLDERLAALHEERARRLGADAP